MFVNHSATFQQVGLSQNWWLPLFKVWLSHMHRSPEPVGISLYFTGSGIKSLHNVRLCPCKPSSEFPANEWTLRVLPPARTTNHLMPSLKSNTVFPIVRSHLVWPASCTVLRAKKEDFEQCPEQILPFSLANMDVYCQQKPTERIVKGNQSQ